MIFLTYNLGKLLQAMARFEGWTEPNEKNGWRGSRAYRNNNPGNLRSSIFECGNHENFSVFKNSFIGWNAFQFDIMQKCKGNTKTKLTPNSTIKDLIHTWAPTSDGNHTQNYIDFVCKETGLDENYRIGDLLID
jgi:hypothetical protein